MVLCSVIHLLSQLNIQSDRMVKLGQIILKELYSRQFFVYHFFFNHPHCLCSFKLLISLQTLRLSGGLVVGSVVFGYLSLYCRLRLLKYRLRLFYIHFFKQKHPWEWISLHSCLSNNRSQWTLFLSACLEDKGEILLSRWSLLLSTASSGSSYTYSTFWLKFP